MDPRFNQGFCNALSHHVSLVSFNSEQFPSLFLSFSTLTFFYKSPGRLFGRMHLTFDLSGCLVKIRFRLNIFRSKHALKAFARLFPGQPCLSLWPPLSALPVIFQPPAQWSSMVPPALSAPTVFPTYPSRSPVPIFPPHPQHRSRAFQSTLWGENGRSQEVRHKTSTQRAGGDALTSRLVSVVDRVGLGPSWSQFHHPVPNFGIQPGTKVGLRLGTEAGLKSPRLGSLSPETGPILAPIVLFTNPSPSRILSCLKISVWT